MVYKLLAKPSYNMSVSKKGHSSMQLYTVQSLIWKRLDKRPQLKTRQSLY